MNRAKYSSFGKIKISNKSKDEKELESLQQKKVAIVNNNSEKATDENSIESLNVRIATKMRTIQEKRFEREIKNLNDLKSNKGKSAATFSLRDKILGNKKVTQEPVVIIDPETEREVTKPAEIKKVSLKYCVNLLTDREPKAEYRNIVTKKDTLHRERMREIVDNDIDNLPYIVFVKTLNILKTKHKTKYEFITKAGNSLVEALYKLFQLIWKKEEIPKGWMESRITQLKKSDAPQNKAVSLDSIRHIHEKNQIFKFFSQIVMTIAKPILYQNMSKYQLASRPGHRASEHLFVLKSIMIEYEEKNKPIFFTSFDITFVYLSHAVGQFFRVKHLPNQRIRKELVYSFLHI